MGVRFYVQLVAGVFERMIAMCQRVLFRFTLKSNIKLDLFTLWNVFIPSITVALKTDVTAQFILIGS